MTKKIDFSQPVEDEVVDQYVEGFSDMNYDQLRYYIGSLMGTTFCADEYAVEAALSVFEDKIRKTSCCE